MSNANETKAGTTRSCDCYMTRVGAVEMHATDCPAVNPGKPRHPIPMTEADRGEAWFEMLDDSVEAERVSDDVAEVFSKRANAPTFVRVRHDDGTVFATLLTDSEAIVGEVRLTNVSESVIAATISAMLA